jgi:PD-(D/E)XK endonuclease
MCSLLSAPRDVSSHPVDVGQHPRSNRRRAFLRAYHGEADVFLVYCPDTERVYALDVDDAASSNCSLRVAPVANGQAKGVRWAADYELPA